MIAHRICEFPSYLRQYGQTAGIGTSLTGTALALFINFLLFRVYSLLRLDLGTRFEETSAIFISGIANDLIFTACLLGLLYALLLAAAIARVPVSICRIFLYIFIGTAIFVSGVLSYIGLEYYRFTKSYLAPQLIRDYLHQLGYIAASLKSSDFSPVSSAVMTGLWLIITGLTFILIRRWTMTGRKALFLFTVFLIFGAAAHGLIKGNYHLAENYVAYLMMHVVSRDSFASPREPAAQTQFDRCLSRQYQYPDKNYPLFRKPRFQTSSTPIVDIRERKPNIIVIFMESFSAAFLDRNLREAVQLTPETEKLIGRGLYFSNFYANGIQTTRGLFSSLCSVYDPFDVQISTHYPDVRLTCLPGLLKKQGYKTHYLQAHDLEFDNMNRSLKVMGFDSLIGFAELPAALQNIKKAGWGIPDEHLFDYATGFVEHSGRQPFFLAVMTLTNHHPFDVPENTFAVYPEDRIENRFRNTIRYADNALGKFIRRLEARGLLKNTIVVITADHSQPMKQHQDNVMATAHAFEENFKIPLIIFSPDYIRKARQYDFIASQVDIVPLLLALMGLPEGENAFVGQNPLSAGACHFAIIVQPYHGGHLVMRYDSWKYEYRRRSRTGVFYDLSRDPLEGNPLVDIPDRKLPRDMPVFLTKTVTKTMNAIQTNCIYPP